MNNKQIANQFKEGVDKRRNVTGANKGSKWKSTLLKDLLTIDLSNTELEQFEELKQKFPNVFGETTEKNFQLFIELKQISLVFHENGSVAQKAIDSIKDRIEGKPTQNFGFETNQPIIKGITFDE